MTLDKSISHGKEHRKPYRKSQKFDRTCRPGGSCPWCRENRLRDKAANHKNWKHQLRNDNKGDGE